jgi:heat shock protein HtpX
MKKTTFYKEITWNRTKSIFIFAFFVCFFIFIGWLVNLYYGGTGYFFVGLAIIIAVVSSLVSYFKGDKIALKLAGARPLKHGENTQLENIVEGLSLAGGIPKPKIYIIEDDGLNAFATGRNPENASVAFTKGLLRVMDKQEIEGVVAHELSHIRNYDMLFLTLTSVLVGSILILSEIILRTFWFGGNRDKNQNPVILVFLIISLILAPIIATLIQLAISRKREYLADASAVELTRFPPGLKRALEKIKKLNYMQDKSKLKKAKSLSPLYFSSPFKGASKFFSTHPPINERIKKLKNM